MLNILYEDKEIIVVVKPVGLESQSSRGFGADMVSEIKKHIHRTSTIKGEPYVGVIHRLDKPVSGIMVYAKTKKAAGILSKAVQDGGMNKQYLAILCGRPVDNVGNYVDYLLKLDGENYSKVVNNMSYPQSEDKKGVVNASQGQLEISGDAAGARRAELDYRVIHTIETAEGALLTLAEIDLHTGRHHQIRVQFAGHGTPLWGDNRYNPEFVDKRGANIALCAWRLSFAHPLNGKKMHFEIVPDSGMFREFQDILILYKRSTNQK